MCLVLWIIKPWKYQFQILNGIKKIFFTMGYIRKLFVFSTWNVKKIIEVAGLLWKIK